MTTRREDDCQKVQRTAKNEKIKATRRATKLRRLGQRCRVYQLKVDKSHLSNKTRAHLQQFLGKQNGSATIF